MFINDKNFQRLSNSIKYHSHVVAILYLCNILHYYVYIITQLEKNVLQSVTVHEMFYILITFGVIQIASFSIFCL